MVLTPSSQVPLGSEAPNFELIDPRDQVVKSLETLKSANGTLIMFICNHCPFVKHVVDGLVTLGNDYMAKGIAVIAINSNDVENYPADSPELMASLAVSKQFPFPYLYDESQAVAKSYRAACTPDFFLYDGQNRLVYRGQLDDSRPGNGIPVSGHDLRLAMDALLGGQPIAELQHPSIGCNIKWKM